MIDVRQIDDTHFEVTVRGGVTTTHFVTVRAEYRSRLGCDALSGAELVRRSFEFLLEREDNTSILRRFDRSEIAGFFPEYERAVRSSG